MIIKSPISESFKFKNTISKKIETTLVPYI